MRYSMRILAVAAVLGMASAAMAADQIDNPEYTQWAKYKPGTFVKKTQTMEMPSMPQMAAMMPQTTVTTKLLEVKADSLTLELTTSTSGGAAAAMGRGNPGAAAPAENKTTKTVPARIDKTTATMPANMAAATQTAEMKDMKEGKETLQIAGKKVETVTREFTTTMDMGTAMGMGAGRAGRGPATTPTATHMKVWSSAEIPGESAKTESTTTVDQMGEMKTKMEVVDFSVVK